MSAADAEDRAAAEAAGLTPEQAAALTIYHSEQNWLLLHRPQLESMQLPPHLWSTLYHKIYTEQFDLPNTFTVAQSDEQGEEGYHLITEREEGVKASEEVWIIEHAWEVKEEDAIPSLMRTAGLVERLWELMDMDRRVEHREEEEVERQRLEREETQRREDRKEGDEEEQERKMKEAEEEKARERDRARTEEEEYVNDDSVACILTQTQSTPEQAAQALKDRLV